MNKYKIKQPEVKLQQSKDYSEEKIDWAFNFIINKCLDIYRFEHYKKDNIINNIKKGKK